MLILYNLIVIKTLRGLADSVCAIFDRLNLEQVLGIVNGIDTVLIVFLDNIEAEYCIKKIDAIINN